MPLSTTWASFTRGHSRSLALNLTGPKRAHRPLKASFCGQMPRDFAEHCLVLAVKGNMGRWIMGFATLLFTCGETRHPDKRRAPDKRGHPDKRRVPNKEKAPEREPFSLTDGGRRSEVARGRRPSSARTPCRNGRRTPSPHRRSAGRGSSGRRQYRCRNGGCSRTHRRASGCSHGSSP